MRKPSKSLQIPSYRFLTLEDFEFLCFDLARELLSYEEPIPDYATRDIPLLESAVSNPSRQFNGELLYPTLCKQAAILFFSIIKNHPFRNGNKRVAVMGLLAHLALNKMWINLHPTQLYQIACDVAQSLPSEKAEQIENLEAIIQKHMISLPSVE